jgi:hypothetical protein
MPSALEFFTAIKSQLAGTIFGILSGLILNPVIYGFSISFIFSSYLTKIEVLNKALI